MSKEIPDAAVAGKATQSPAARRRGWWSRSWRWFLPSLFLAVVVLCVAGALCFYLFNVKPLRLEPYPAALQSVRKDARVIAKLGEPIRDVRWIPTGERIVDGDRGEARLDFDVAGPKGRAHVRYQARCIAGQWGFSQLEVVLDSGERISIATDAGGDEAPRFQTPKSEGKEPSKNAPPQEINMPVPPVN